MSEQILALDFDGVICDSLPECYVSGFLASQGVWSRDAAQDLVESWKQASPQYVDFCLWRPFVRSGEDYVLIAGLMARGVISPTTQPEMDQHIRAAGMAVMTEFKKNIYAVREWLLKEMPDLWLELNPLMSPLEPFLAPLSQNPGVWILSTKKPRFIHLILEHHHIVWSEQRVLEASGETKLKVMDRFWGDQCSVVFMDDQPDHFEGLPGRIQCLLPVWGYVKPEWITRPEGYGILYPDDLASVLKKWV